jgi:hypothetical protein
MPNQKAAAVMTLATINSQRRRFFRAATTIVPRTRKRKTSSAQKKREPNPELHWPALSCNHTVAKDVAAVSEIATTPASAMPFAHSGMTQSFLVSRQSSHVWPTTRPTRTRTNSATCPPQDRAAPAPPNAFAFAGTTHRLLPAESHPQCEERQCDRRLRCFDRPSASTISNGSSITKNSAKSTTESALRASAAHDHMTLMRSLPVS